MTATRLALTDALFLFYIKFHAPRNRQILICPCHNDAAAQHSVTHAKSALFDKIDAAHYPKH